MSAKIASAVDALAAQTAAKNAQKDATVAVNEAARLLGEYGATLIKQIRAKAEQVGGDSVYVLASVPPPATPTPAGAPGLPYGFNISLNNVGAIVFTWKNRNAKGSVYAIYRALDGSSEYENLGGTAEKKFTDTTVPAGTSQIVYRVQAIRSTGVSDWAIVNVALGGGSGSMFVTEGAPLKKAA